MVPCLVNGNSGTSVVRRVGVPAHTCKRNLPEGHTVLGRWFSHSVFEREAVCVDFAIDSYDYENEMELLRESVGLVRRRHFELADAGGSRLRTGPGRPCCAVGMGRHAA